MVEVNTRAEHPSPPRLVTPGCESVYGGWGCFRLRWTQIQTLVQETATNAFQHNIQRLGASLAFYTALSLAPLLIVIVGIAGVAFSRQEAVGQIVWQMQNLVGTEGAKVIQTLLNGARKPASGTIATILGLVTLFVGASTVVTELKDALNTVWNIRQSRKLKPMQSVLNVIKTRVVSFAMVLGIGFLLIVSLAVNAVVTALGSLLPGTAHLLQVADVALTFVVIALLFASLFKLLPDTYVAWSDVALGALITALLFTAGKFLIGLYLGHATITSTYGAAGSLVVLLVWIYYSAQIFYLGAEFTHAYAESYGSRPSQHPGKVEIITIAGSEKAQPTMDSKNTNPSPLITTPPRS